MPEIKMAVADDGVLGVAGDKRHRQVGRIQGADRLKTIGTGVSTVRKHMPRVSVHSSGEPWFPFKLHIMT